MAAVREVKVICTPARGDVLSHIHHIESTNIVNQTDPRAVFVCIYVHIMGWGGGWRGVAGVWADCMLHPQCVYTRHHT